MRRVLAWAILTGLIVGALVRSAILGTFDGVSLIGVAGSLAVILAAACGVFDRSVQR